jgi:ribokinase
LASWQLCALAFKFLVFAGEALNKYWDILGLGAVAVDDLIYVDHYPPADSKIRVESRQRQGGGLAGTALVTAARLGVKPAYFGILGDNELSRYTRQQLEREGVDCSAVRIQAEAEPFHSTIIVVQPTAQRTVLSWAKSVIAVRPAEITDELIARCRVLFIDHTVIEAALCAVDIAHRHNIPVVADIEAERHPHVYDLIPQIDHLILGVKFAQQITGEKMPEKMARALSVNGRACSVVTAGDQGCWYAERGREVKHFPAFQVHAVDTTGCGDVFHGAYAACLAKEMSIENTIKIASATAALKATQPGGRRGIPTWPAVQDFLHKK